MQWWVVAFVLGCTCQGFAEEATHEGHAAEHWADELASSDMDARRRAVYALFQLDGAARAHVRDLAKALRDSDEYVRTTANRALMRWAFGKLIDVLPKALPELIQALGDERDTVRRDAAHLVYLAGPIPNVSGGPAPPAALVAALGQALSDPVSKVRANAAASLGNIAKHSKPALKQLAAAVGDDDATVRRYAVQVMGWIDAPTALPHALKALGDPTAAVRAAALGAIGGAPVPMADETIAAIGAVLSDADETVRVAAVNCLWASGEPRGHELLAGVLKNDPGAPVRATAANALGGLGDARALPLLLAALEDRSPPVRAAAANGLGRIGPEGAVAVDALMQILRSPNESGMHRAATQALSSLAPWAGASIPLVARALDQSDAQTGASHASAVHQLATYHKDPRLLQAAIRALQRDDQFTRQYALQAVTEFGASAGAALPEIRAMLADKGWFNRRGLHTAVASLGTAGAPLTAALRLEVEAGGADALGAAGALARIATDPQAIGQAVAHLMKSVRQPKQHFEALIFLHRAGTRAAPARALLVQVLAEEPTTAMERSAQAYAAGALVQIGGADAVRALAWLLKRLEPNQASVIAVLGDCGAAARGAVAGLIPIASDPSARRRTAALTALRKIGARGPEVRSVYEQAREDSDAWTRTQGALGLLDLGD